MTGQTWRCPACEVVLDLTGWPGGRRAVAAGVPQACPACKARGRSAELPPGPLAALQGAQRFDDGVLARPCSACGRPTSGGYVIDGIRVALGVDCHHRNLSTLRAVLC